MICTQCSRPNCKPKSFRLCPVCEGLGCTMCADSLVLGILEGVGPEDESIIVCSEWGDPEVDAAVDDTRTSLIAALKKVRDELRA